MRESNTETAADARAANDDVIEDSRERTPDVPPWAFEPKTQDEEPWMRDDIRAVARCSGLCRQCGTAGIRTGARRSGTLTCGRVRSG
jgi:hypothetical protein